MVGHRAIRRAHLRKAMIIEQRHFRCRRWRRFKERYAPKAIHLRTITVTITTTREDLQGDFLSWLK